MKPFGVGIDIVDLRRTEFDNSHFCERFMTKKEFENYLVAKNKKMYAAGIWCIKEAIIKALNHNLIFSEITIEFTNEAPISIFKDFQVFLSISYEKEIATAIAISYKTNVNE